MAKRRKRRASSSLGLRVVVVAVVFVTLAAIVWWVTRGGGPTPARHAGTHREFGARLKELAGRRGATTIDADDPIRKINGVFVRTWWITVPDVRCGHDLEADLASEAPRWQASLRRETPGRHDWARLRFSLRVEVFDIHLRIGMKETAVRRPPTTKASPRPTQRPALAAGARGRLAIMLDDAGLRMDVVKQAARLPKAVAVSILPFLPHSADAAIALHRAGHEVWLHLPMEPVGYPREDPGPGAILVRMPESAVRFAVRSALNDVPFIVGVNNHMGSRATANLRVMTWVMQEIAARHLAFIDSRTTVKTVAEEAARAQGLRTGRRNVFLDNVQTPESIRRQLDEAVYDARRNGHAIAIGHVHPVTIRVLARELPHLSARGADLVPPSKLVR